MTTAGGTVAEIESTTKKHADQSGGEEVARAATRGSRGSSRARLVMHELGEMQAVLFGDAHRQPEYRMGGIGQPTAWPEGRATLALALMLQQVVREQLGDGCEFDARYVALDGLKALSIMCDGESRVEIVGAFYMLDGTAIGCCLSRLD
jgi:hypothetical protein